MNILVTGGAGFIASHIVDKLIAVGHRVAVMDNLSTGSISNVTSKARFYEVDILDKKINEIIKAEKPQVVIHHAAQIDIQKSLQDPVFDGQVNILGTINLLKACINHGVEKIIYASSAAVYGDPEYLPVDELHPVGPISYYGISKHTPEHYIETFSRLHGLKYTVLRYANAFGPRQDPKGEGGVVSIFVDKLLKGDNPTIFGDGLQTRDFVYVDDIARANVFAIDRGDNEIINISSNARTSVSELFETMRELTGLRLQPCFEAARAGDILHSALDNKKARDLLNWTPAYNLAVGLKETIEYYKPLY